MTLLGFQMWQQLNLWRIWRYMHVYLIFENASDLNITTFKKTRQLEISFACKWALFQLQIATSVIQASLPQCTLITWQLMIWINHLKNIFWGWIGALSIRKSVGFSMSSIFPASRAFKGRSINSFWEKSQAGYFEFCGNHDENGRWICYGKSWWSQPYRQFVLMSRIACMRPCKTSSMGEWLLRQ